MATPILTPIKSMRRALPQKQPERLSPALEVSGRRLPETSLSQGPELPGFCRLAPQAAGGKPELMWPPHFLPLILRLPFLGSVPRLPPVPCRDRESGMAWIAIRCPPCSPPPWSCFLALSSPTPVLPLPAAEDAPAPAGLVSGWPGPGFSGSVSQTSDLRNAGSCQRWRETVPRRAGGALAASSDHQPH